jgi:hypothetical protein
MRILFLPVCAVLSLLLLLPCRPGGDHGAIAGQNVHHGCVGGMFSGAYARREARRERREQRRGCYGSGYGTYTTVSYGSQGGSQGLPAVATCDHYTQDPPRRGSEPSVTDPPITPSAFYGTASKHCVGGVCPLR